MITHSKETYQPTSIMRWDRVIFNGSHDTVVITQSLLWPVHLMIHYLPHGHEFNLLGVAWWDAKRVGGGIGDALGPAGLDARSGGVASATSSWGRTCWPRAPSRRKWQWNDFRREEVGDPRACWSSHESLPGLEDWRCWTGGNQCIWQHRRSARPGA